VSSRRQPFQIIAGPIFRQTFSEIEFDSRTEHARRWWPQGREVSVVLDPAIAFGAPVIPGTRVPTAIIGRYAETHTVSAVAEAFDLPPERIQAAVRFESRLARAA
jgi:uncharacterized protein (DUF433 family)